MRASPVLVPREGALNRLGSSITPQVLKTFARQARKRMRTEAGGYRRDYLRALAQRVEVDAKELRIMGSKSELLRTLVAASSAKTAGFGVPSFVPKWRAQRDSNSCSRLVVKYWAAIFLFDLYRSLDPLAERSREGAASLDVLSRADVRPDSVTFARKSHRPGCNFFH